MLPQFQELPKSSYFDTDDSGSLSSLSWGSPDSVLSVLQKSNIHLGMKGRDAPSRNGNRSFVREKIDDSISDADDEEKFTGFGGTKKRLITHGRGTAVKKASVAIKPDISFSAEGEGTSGMLININL
jgi:hypothetical protein